MICNGECSAVNLNCAPLATTLFRRPSLSNASATTIPAAQARGLPPIRHT